MNDRDRQLAETGVCVVPGVLDSVATARIRTHLLRAADAFQRSGARTFMPELDPNDRNVRVFNLIELDEIFRDLILHPAALHWVRMVLDEHYTVSNFTANIALPGSRSMALHSDQALVAPESWTAAWSMNVIWCLDDVYEASGATRYIPGSHRFQRAADLPANSLQQTVAFEAPAGSIVVMDGRVWHTSGANVRVAAAVLARNREYH